MMGLSAACRCLRAGLCKALAVGLLLAAAESHAADSDVVTLASGNRLTGTVRGLSRGVLRFSIPEVGTIDIDWTRVQALQSEAEMGVELASGRQLSGLITSPSAGVLAVRTAGAVESFPKQDIVRIRPVRATFLERTQGSADLGLGFLTANDELDLTLNGDVEHRTGNYLTSVSLSALLRRLDDQTAQRRDDFDINVRRLRQDRWFVLGRFGVQDNRQLDLDLRLLTGAALGRTLHQSQQTIFATYAGVDYVYEEYRNQRGSDTSPEAFASVEWDWFEFDGKTELDLKATVYEALDRSRERIELDSSLRRYIVRDFYWALNLYESYDGDPPPGREHSDFGVSLTFGNEF